MVFILSKFPPPPHSTIVLLRFSTLSIKLFVSTSNIYTCYKVQEKSGFRNIFVHLHDQNQFLSKFGSEHFIFGKKNYNLNPFLLMLIERFFYVIKKCHNVKLSKVKRALDRSSRESQIILSNFMRVISILLRKLDPYQYDFRLTWTVVLIERLYMSLLSYFGFTNVFFLFLKIESTSSIFDCP